MKYAICMVGTTGAGKTTHGKLLAHKMGVFYISSGDIARQMMDEKTTKEFHNGQLSPHEDAIRDTISGMIHHHEIFILDGFPRLYDQMLWLRNLCDITLYKVELAWSQKVLVNRWMGRSRDEFDTLKTYVLRDEVYHEKTKLLYDPVDGYLSLHNSEMPILELNLIIRENVQKWLKTQIPEWKCTDSSKQRAIDQFIGDHHITFWRPDRLSTFGMQESEIERKLWEIINA